jgi:hypothetical protein
MVEKVHKFSCHCPSVCFGTGKEEKPMEVGKKTFKFTKLFFSLLFGPLLLSKLTTFSFLLHFKLFKVL